MRLKFCLCKHKCFKHFFLNIVKEFDKENDGKVTKMFYEELAKAFIEKLRELLAHGKIIVPLFVKDEEQFLQIAKYISSAETFLNLQNLIKDYNGGKLLLNAYFNLQYYFLNLTLSKYRNN